MTLKLKHMSVLFVSLLLGAAAMYIEINPWLRIAVAGSLLLPIIYAADGMGVAPMLKVLPQPRERHRRFGVLRFEVMQLLDLVRRLNWLTVDLTRGVRPEKDVRAEITAAERRLDEVLAEIRRVAGQPSNEPPPSEQPSSKQRTNEESDVSMEPDHA